MTVPEFLWDQYMNLREETCLSRISKLWFAEQWLGGGTVLDHKRQILAKSFENGYLYIKFLIDT